MMMMIMAVMMNKSAHVKKSRDARLQSMRVSRQFIKKIYTIMINMYTSKHIELMMIKKQVIDNPDTDWAHYFRGKKVEFVNCVP